MPELNESLAMLVPILAVTKVAIEIVMLFCRKRCKCNCSK